ncbi:acyltransferase [Mucilaginibacter terrae]|uniref:Acetyltransferase-like isoleucine patch superfamily enzyme n=1 Tax=Mucilaginibacter terrae TaxID=1955052 RepID=A0ABU3GYE8_9SPHI|nr:acyltransferase [Mucilaginibacter terrae]MDT3404784.1 acetyltransferase-like isoleucine patch superfamily enzyme [Mucilaginibacter terrae]
MSLKSIIKSTLLKLRLRGVNCRNIDAWTYIGKYTILKTADSRSSINFNQRIDLHNYVSLVAEDGGQINFGKRVSIGDYSTLRASRAQITIGDNTMLAQGVKLISTNHAYKDKNKLIHEQDIDTEKIGITIGSDCWLGAGCVVLPGVTIANGVVVGANAVVTKDVPEYAIVVGIPAKVIAYRT